MYPKTVAGKRIVLVFCLMSLTTLKQCDAWSQPSWIIELGAFHPWATFASTDFGLAGVAWGEGYWMDASAGYFYLNIVLSLILFHLLGRVSFSEAALRGIVTAYLLFQCALMVPLFQAITLLAMGDSNGVRWAFWQSAAVLTALYHAIMTSNRPPSEHS
jgi:hypothetical protein